MKPSRYHSIKAGDVFESRDAPGVKYVVERVQPVMAQKFVDSATLYAAHEFDQNSFLRSLWRKLSPDEAEVWRVMES